MNSPAKRRELLDRQPAVWLFRRRTNRTWSTALTVLIGGTLIVILASSADLSGGDLPSAMLAIAFFSGLAIKIGIAAYAAHAMADLRESGILEGVLATPLSGRDMMAGHQRTAILLWISPVLLLSSLYVVLLLGLMLQGLENEMGWFPLGFILLDGLSQVCDFVALFWTATWFGFTSGRGNASAIKALLLVHILPVFLCCGLRAISDLIFWNWAKGRLRADFRRVAGQSSTRESDALTSFPAT